ncbi:trehalose-phosphatase [Frondihabitans australicus]|uniref:Trehalose 6-phosphate phosphatase n=1 Tax=Frondihabitans australicus TaxID=386892 RepID=A0A495IE56_9MICO|nr:trehalose-phosphatase [Frondihabitans australicus]RKR73621.1 trehalose 6-phosphatase [Frondihabitans australicus]
MSDQAAETAMADALGLIATTPHLLVALDFDGTLSPTVDRPQEARALPDAQDAVLRLAAMPHTSVALVSGRSLESLAHVGQVPDSVLLVGSHGVEYRVDGASDVALTDDEKATRETIHRVLDEVAGSFENVHVEEKPAGFALHTRLANGDDTAAAERLAQERVASSTTGVTERSGKDVLEFSVRSATKGDAVRRLRSITGATAVLFAGDDVTDEDGFTALGAGDFGLKVGAGETAAAFRVDGPPEVAHLLDDLAELRAHLGRA